VFRFGIGIGALALLVACGRPGHEEKSFVLATTTSIDNSGLLPHLAGRFRDDTGIVIHPMVVGSGKALRLGREVRVQVLLTHDPRGEQDFVRSGNAAIYQKFARNDFILVGPPTNPAGVVSADSVLDAFRKIHATRSRFVSRGDESGTHVRELEIWKLAGSDPGTNPGYTALGQSMSALLRSADQLQAYTLADRATFAQLFGGLELRTYIEQGPFLENTYAVTLVKSSGEEAEYGARFVKWLLSPNGREAVASFRIAGKPAFFLIE